MKAPEGFKYVVAKRKFRGRGGKDVKPGTKPHMLHETAARAAYFRGDARYATKADFAAPNTGDPVPMISKADQKLIDDGKKADILARLREVTGNEDAGKREDGSDVLKDDAKALLKAALGG